MGRTDAGLVRAGGVRRRSGSPSRSARRAATRRRAAGSTRSTPTSSDPVQGGQEIVFRSEVVKAGRTFNLHHVTASQDGKPVITMTCSFTDRHRRLRVRPVGDPRRRAPARGPPRARRRRVRGRPVGRALARAERRCDPTAPARRRTATGSACPADLDDDPHLHTALLGYATDWTGIGGRPLHLDGDTTGMISLDHAAWFHRPARADEWLLQDVQSLVNAGGRGTLRGVIRNTQGRSSRRWPRRCSCTRSRRERRAHRRCDTPPDQRDQTS